MKNVAINFKINSLFLFLFFLLGIIVTTFGQTDSTDEGADISLVPQAYGEETLINVHFQFDVDGGLYITIEDEDYLGEVVFVEHKNGAMEVSVADLPEFFDAASDSTGREYEFDGKADVYDIYLKTTAGVTSMNLVKEGNRHYMLCNGKINGIFVDGDFKEGLNDRPADAFKNKVDWQYGPEKDAE